MSMKSLPVHAYVYVLGICHNNKILCVGLATINKDLVKYKYQIISSALL